MTRASRSTWTTSARGSSTPSASTTRSSSSSCSTRALPSSTAGRDRVAGEDALQLHQGAGRRRRPLAPGALNVVLLWAMVLDAILLLARAILRLHLRMASKNQTTIDGDRYPQYDLEVERNLQSAFGRRAAPLVARTCRWRHPCCRLPPSQPRTLALDASPGPPFIAADHLRRKRWMGLLPLLLRPRRRRAPTSEGGRTGHGQRHRTGFPACRLLVAPPVVGQTSSALADPGLSSGTSTRGGGGRWRR